MLSSCMPCSSLGFEFEMRLRRELEDQNISFLHEDHLRARGYDKTPDIKLEIPVGMAIEKCLWLCFFLLTNLKFLLD